MTQIFSMTWIKHLADLQKLDGYQNLAKTTFGIREGRFIH